MPKYTMRKAIGIDLGTTNSAVAVMTPTDTDITIHSDPKTRRETTPSCVWKDPKNGQVVVGSKAYSRVGSRPEPIKSIKRSMGRQTTLALTNERVTPEQVSAYILSEMKRQIEDNLRGFETETATWVVDRAIVTVPAYFDQPQIEATRKAAEMAGLQVLELLHEPTAAACYHCWQNQRQDGLFLVYDFGGGTFDVSILRCTSGVFEVLGIRGNNFLGGDDLDAVIAEEILRRLVAEDYDLALDIQHDEDDQLRFARLKLLAEGVKKALSNATDFVLRDTNSVKDKAGAGVDIDMNFERDEVEQLMRPIIEHTIPYCYEALELAQQRAGVTLAQIDEIILAGGTTHIPLVRDIVRETFCSSPGASGERARCSELVYRKVDTIVALGAAIRAAATGGLAIDNPERTVRVTFKGIGITASKRTYVTGQVEALSPALNLAGGSIRLRIADLGYDDEQPLKSDGAFGFSRVELQAATENLLTFEIYSRDGARLATVIRPISQNSEARSTGGPTGTATTAKAYYLEVNRAGKATRKELFPASASLPAEANFQLFHPGNTERLLLPLYQNKKKIQEINVPVPASLPKGTPIDLHIEVDALSGITVSGSVKGTDRTFKAHLEIPAERDAPTPGEVQQLDQSFHEVAVSLPSEQKTRVEDQYRRARSSYEEGMRRGEFQRAIHDFEEMEDLVESSKYEGGPLQPPKDFFDSLVNECQIMGELLETVTQSSHARDIITEITRQQAKGDNAFANNDQTAYRDTIIKLNALREHLISLLVRLADGFEDTRSDLERATDNIDFALEQANEVDILARAAERTDLQSEIALLRSQVQGLGREVQRDPVSVFQSIVKIRQRLEQIRNVLVGLLKQSPHSNLLNQLLREE